MTVNLSDQPDTSVQGWIWISTRRTSKQMDCRKLGLLNGPHKRVIQVRNEVGKVKTMLIDPSVFDKLMAKRNNASTSKSNDAIPPPSTKMEIDGQSDEIKKEEGGEATSTEESSEEETHEECKKFKTDLINVSLGIVSANRILYPKIAHKVPFLDGLLARRLRLYNLEEKELITKYGTKILEKVKANVDLTATEQPIAIKIDDKFPLGAIYVDYKCYSYSCNVDAKSEKKDYESLCCSPLCRLKFGITQNHTRKLERIKKKEMENYEKARKEILEKRYYTLPESSGKVYLKKPQNELRKLARSFSRHFTPASTTDAQKQKQNTKTSLRDNHAKPGNTRIIEAPTTSQQNQQQNAGRKCGTKSGQINVITTTVITSSPVSTAPGLTSSTNPVILNRKISSGVISKPTTSNPPQQEQSAGLIPNIQLYKTADGKLQIRGLAPGQRAYQTSDGRVHVLTPPSQQQIQVVVKMHNGKLQIIRGPGQRPIINDGKLLITQPPHQAKQP